MDTIDRSGARWRLDATPEFSVRRPVPDLTAALGLAAPNIWSEGGNRLGVTLTFGVIVPDGASGPDFPDLLRRIEAALRG